jgi:hypothetical protein
MNENIAKAFVAAQTAFGPALKDSNNPFFKSKYADLSMCVKAVIDALHSNGIALMQNCHESEGGVTVETVFLHTSGETISCGKLSVPAAKNDPQGYGSALTYARRYSLMAACAIAPEDDDGNAGSQAIQPKAQPGIKLPVLTDEQCEREFEKWLQVKSLLVDEDGDQIIEQVNAEWFKLPSNVRTGINKWGKMLEELAKNEQPNKEHIKSITQKEAA